MTKRRWDMVRRALGHAASYLPRILRGHVPQHEGTGHEDTYLGTKAQDIGYVGRHRWRLEQEPYRKAGAVHRGEWYDQETGAWQILAPGEWK